MQQHLLDLDLILNLIYSCVLMPIKNLLLIPDSIRQLRVRQGQSQGTVADQAHVAQSLLCAIEKGRKIVGLEQVERIVRVLTDNSVEIQRFKDFATHDQIVAIVSQRYSESHAEMVSIALRTHYTLSEGELENIKSLLEECITAKSLLENPRSELKMSP